MLYIFHIFLKVQIIYVMWCRCSCCLILLRFFLHAFLTSLFPCSHSWIIETKTWKLICCLCFSSQNAAELSLYQQAREGKREGQILQPVVRCGVGPVDVEVGMIFLMCGHGAKYELGRMSLESGQERRCGVDFLHLSNSPTMLLYGVKLLQISWRAGAWESGSRCSGWLCCSSNVNAHTSFVL